MQSTSQCSSSNTSYSDSYPPCFRQQLPVKLDANSADNDVDQKHSEEEEDDPLPVIDLGCIDYEKLSVACRDWGIFRLVNHGIPVSLLSEVHEQAVRVFEMGFESKVKVLGSIPATAMSYFWGSPALTSAGVALHKESDGDDENKVAFNNNWFEGLNVSLSQPSQAHGQLDQHPLLIDFRTLLEEYGVHQERIAKLIYDAMSQNLNLSTENECYLSPSTGTLRIYRYPRCFSDKQTKVWGMEMHTDSSVLTILNQDEVGGLQILSEKDNVWIDAKPIPNTLLVHLGDMMQAISDDKYKSVKHRVRVNREKERISMGYFVFPGHDCVIRSSNYKPFTYSEFKAQVQEDVKALGVKVGLSRFKVV